MSRSFSLPANLVDIHQQTTYPTAVVVNKGKIVSIFSPPGVNVDNPKNFELQEKLDLVYEIIGVQ